MGAQQPQTGSVGLTKHPPNPPASPDDHRDRKSIPGLASRQAATTILTRVFDDRRSLDGLLDTRHGPPAYQKLDDADRGLVRAIVTTALRHSGEIDHALARMMDRKPPKNARHLLNTLKVAAAQILFLDLPDSAAVNLAVAALKQDKRSVRFASFGNAILRRMVREKDDLFTGLDEGARAKLNVPAWLWKRWRKDYGKQRAAEIAAQHMLEPVIDICVKSDPQAWGQTLGGLHLQGSSVRVRHGGRISQWPGYDEGEWWVQDAAAALPVHLMGDLRDVDALDLCAAPGGKTAQMALAGARVTAIEKNRDRLDRLGGNLSRLGLSANTIEADMMEWQPDALFDAILLDAPCSSTGTIRRHPDVAHTKTQADIEALAQLQYQMLLRAAGFLKPGGILVFSNCSLDRTEGEDMIARIGAPGHAPTGLILDRLTGDDVFGNDEWVTGQSTLRTLPSHLPVDPASGFDAGFSGLDGFFAARFRKE